MDIVSQESKKKKSQLLRTVIKTRSNLLMLAPADYWESFDMYAGGRYDWKQPLSMLGEQIEACLKIKVRFVSIRNCSWTSNGTPSLNDLSDFLYALDNRERQREG